MATHSSTLAWKTPWTEELGGLQSTGSQRVGHDWVPEHSTHKLPAQWFPVWLCVQTRCPPRSWQEDASCFKSDWCSHISLTLFFSTGASHLSVIPSFSLSAETLPTVLNTLSSYPGLKRSCRSPHSHSTSLSLQSLSSKFMERGSYFYHSFSILRAVTPFDTLVVTYVFPGITTKWLMVFVLFLFNENSPPQQLIPIVTRLL